MHLGLSLIFTLEVSIGSYQVKKVAEYRVDYEIARLLFDENFIVN